MSNLSEITARASEPNTILADGLRGTLQDLDEAIRNCRICIRSGDARKAEYLADYLRLVHLAHERKDELQAASFIVQPVCGPHLPMPFIPQVVGKNKFAREWNMAHMAVPPAITSPAPSAVHWLGNRAA